MFCKYCGTQTADDAQFCPKCGKSTGAQIAQNNTPSAPQKTPSGINLKILIPIVAVIAVLLVVIVVKVIGNSKSNTGSASATFDNISTDNVSNCSGCGINCLHVCG